MEAGPYTAAWESRKLAKRLLLFFAFLGAMELFLLALFRPQIPVFHFMISVALFITAASEAVWCAKYSILEMPSL